MSCAKCNQPLPDDDGLTYIGNDGQRRHIKCPTKKQLAKAKKAALAIAALKMFDIEDHAITVDIGHITIMRNAKKLGLVHDVKFGDDDYITFEHIALPGFTFVLGGYQLHNTFWALTEKGKKLKREEEND